MSASETATASRPPGEADALRATAGVVCAYGVALLLAGLVAVIGGAANDGIRSAGDTRAQLAVQAMIFAAAALLLVEGLRLAHRPRERDPLAAAADERPQAPSVLTVVAVGMTGAIGALLVGPLVSAVLPHLHDVDVPVDELGLGKGIGADIGTVIVVAGLVPFGEELLFRGVLVGAWARADRPAIGAGVSAVLFGLAHITVGPRAMAVTLLLGLLFAVVLLASRSLGAAILAHALTNAQALLDAGLHGLLPIATLVVTVLVASGVGVRISRSVLSLPGAGTLDR